MNDFSTKFRSKISIVLFLSVGLLTLFSFWFLSSTGAPSIQAQVRDRFHLDDSFAMDQPLFIHFWAKWCEPCVEEIPQLIEFSKQVDVTILAVSLDSTLEEAQSILPDSGKDLPRRFKVVLDPQQQFAESMGSFQYPETFWVGASGKVLEKWVGPQKWKSPEVIEFFKQKLN